MTARSTQPDPLTAPLKALADPSRLRILRLLARADGGLPVMAVVAAVGLNQATVSHHLRVLVEAGLLHCPMPRQSGRGSRVHYLVDARLDELAEQIRDLS